MTSAVVPALLEQPDLATQWLPKITALQYDHRNIPMEQKSAITVGMAMTEKQGGSDVRANTLRAHAVGAGRPGSDLRIGGPQVFCVGPDE
jgi:putative acyl-CoA dehydrogenase